MTLKFILVGFREGKTMYREDLYPSLKEANRVGNYRLTDKEFYWEHFTVVPVAIPDEDDLSLM